jgi:cytidine deaminase
MTNNDLIQRAESVLNPYTTKDGRLFGDVGAALVTAQGNVFSGVCADTVSWGLCAERSAIAAMITAGEYKIEKIVAVWKDPKTDKLFALPPCGVCREFIRQVDGENINTDVILGRNVVEKLSSLIPHHEWPKPLDGDVG